jgi:rhodanese-related sulfurtransferase
LELRLRIAPDSSGSFLYSVAVKGGEQQPTLLARFEVTVTDEPEAAPPDEDHGRALLIEAGEVGRVADSGEAWVIGDVRPRARFLLGHIEGAWNLPLRDLRVRPFLRAKPILVVGDGHDTERLLSEAVSLAASGFNHVRVLDGGLRAWQRAGRALAGVAPHSERLFTLTPTEALASLGDPKVLWISVTQADRSRTVRALELPTVQRATLDELPRVLAERPRAWAAHPDVSSAKAEPGASDRTGDDHAPHADCILVSSDSDSDYRSIEAQWGSQGGVPVFFVEGGEAGLAQTLGTEARLAQRGTVTIVSGQAVDSVRTGGTGHGRGCCGKVN